VFDPFGGSNTTGFIAEKLGRRWFISEISEEYLQGSKFRFVDDGSAPPAKQSTESTQEFAGTLPLFPTAE
nr:site-specific DNA-methyltransferase [Pseudomonadota bacterium]